MSLCGATHFNLESSMTVVNICITNRLILSFSVFTVVFSILIYSVFALLNAFNCVVLFVVISLKLWYFYSYSLCILDFTFTFLLFG